MTLRMKMAFGFTLLWAVVATAGFLGMAALYHQDVTMAIATMTEASSNLAKCQQAH